MDRTKLFLKDTVLVEILQDEDKEGKHTFLAYWWDYLTSEDKEALREQIFHTNLGKFSKELEAKNRKVLSRYGE